MSPTALIFTDNFIINATLTDILYKLGVEVVTVTTDWNKAKAALITFSPSHIFIDYQSIDTTDEALKASQFFHSISDSEITFMIPEDSNEIVQNHMLNIFSNNQLSTPFNAQSVKKVISNEAISYFYGVDY